MAPDLVRPADDVPLGIEAARELHRHRRSVRLPLELVVAHPLQLDRVAARRARDQRRIERHVVGAVVAVAAGAFGVDAVDVRGIDRERLGEIAAQRKHALAVRPHRELALAPLRHRARRADRAVDLEGARVGRVQRLCGCRGSRGGLFANHGLDRLCSRHQVLVQGVARRRQRCALLPLRGFLEQLARADRLLLALGGQPQEIAVAHDRDHAGHALHGGLVEGNQPRAG